MAARRFVSAPHVPDVTETKERRRHTTYLGLRRGGIGGKGEEPNANAKGLSDRGLKKCRLTGRTFSPPPREEREAHGRRSFSSLKEVKRAKAASLPAPILCCNMCIYVLSSIVKTDGVLCNEEDSSLSICEQENGHICEDEAIHLASQSITNTYNGSQAHRGQAAHSRPPLASVRPR
ncbi:hypothetical protein EYF80_025178 [Liparis tanakae]|uniref:Uncharacterized protein n=1 Tax=Liparis tanakae TaxID=230148 RepID=A0A4Z2HG15_9TELE|nr:hypothetical protein EYF80_025178 [Liparis tanakae]